LGSIWLQIVKFWFYLGSFGLNLGSFWVRFFTIVNNDGHSLGSFFQKNFFAGREAEVWSQKPEFGGAGGGVMD